MSTVAELLLRNQIVEAYEAPATTKKLRTRNDAAEGRVGRFEREAEKD